MIILCVKTFFNAKPFKKNYLPNGLATDIEAEAKRYDQIIAEHPIDFQVLGIGRNGHIGFNEPGTSFEEETHVVDLQESTIEANSRFFTSIEDVPKQAISMGIASIMKSKMIVLLAFGQEKADAIKGMVLDQSQKTSQQVFSKNMIMLSSLWMKLLRHN